MYPGTKVNWYDESALTDTDIESIDNMPLFMMASSFDKGPEEMKRVSGESFYNLYGSTMSFERHGQAAITASAIIDAGGELLIKRVVANDATLANVVFLATVTTSTTEDEDTEPGPAEEEPDATVTSAEELIAALADADVSTIQLDADIIDVTVDTINGQKTISCNDHSLSMTVDIDGNTDTISADGTSVVTLNEDGTYSIGEASSDSDTGTDDDEDSEVDVASGCTIKWSAVTIENCYSFEEVVEQANAMLDEDAGVYPILVVTDNGRGESDKAFKLAANSELSVTLGKVFYTASTYEGTTRTEYTTGTINSCLYRDKNYGVEEWTMDQVKLNVDPYIYNQFLAKLADDLGTDVDTVDSYDLFTGLTVKGLAVDGLTIDDESIDIGADYGVELSGGSNGEFGKAPVNTDAWEDALIDFFDGSYTDEIYDLDEYKVAFIPDCAYPWDVKEAIAELVTFREDCVFLRDMLFEVSNYASAVMTLEKFKTSNKFITNYMTYYQIYDPATKKRIKVTMIYDLVKCMVAQYNTGIHTPQAGIANGYILESPIEGTVNYTPRITPSVNQKQMLDDLRLNYATFFNGQCIVQSLYTSQEAYSQLSYLNNVLAIQEVVRSVRTSCPKKRYTFIEDHDFSEYAEHVNNVLKGFSSNFDTLKFEYTKDTLLANQKIFYASIRFAFKDWAQSEIFDVYAINNTDLASTTTN